MGQFSDRAIEIAQEFVGLTESGKNDAPWLRDLMKTNPTGWRCPESYCIAALCSIAEKACKELGITFPFPYSKSTQLFYVTAVKHNFASQIPERGDIAIFEIGHSGFGHAEIITGTGEGGITTIGFNTSGSAAGNQHNGEGVFEKLRRFKDFPKTDLPKLWIRGYIKISQL